MKVHVYIGMSTKAPKKARRKYAYVLESQVGGEAVTREHFGETEDTLHGATVKAIEQALARITKPDSSICIHAEDGWVLDMLGHHMQRWQRDSFLRKDGSPIAKQKEWMHIWLLLEKAEVTTQAGRHAYTDWMQRRFEEEA